MAVYLSFSTYLATLFGYLLYIHKLPQLYLLLRMSTTKQSVMK